MIQSHVALVPEFPGFDPRVLSRVAAALQKQVMRDLAPIWQVTATVDAFERLEDVPIDYWPLIVTNRDLGGQEGVHLDDHGKPYALVEARSDWSLTASHECIEMIIDPSGARTVAGQSPRADQGRVEFLVEVCDPCEGANAAYSVNGVVVSDFVTPAYYEPLTRDGGRYSFSGQVKQPRGLLAGGYLSWRDPITGSWWQREMVDDSTTKDKELGRLEAAARGHRSLREAINLVTQHHTYAARRKRVRKDDVTPRDDSRASNARARYLRGQLRELPALAPAPKAPTFASTFGTNQAPPPRSLPVADEIRRGIDTLNKRPPGLPDRELVLATLTQALDDWTRSCEDSARKDHEEALVHVESKALSIVSTSIRTPQVAPTHAALMGRDIVGFGKYEDLDPAWLATVWNHVVTPVAKFPDLPTPDTVVHPLQKTCTIAIAGDWGTGDDSSKAIARQISNLNPTYTIHLGDVYYSGTAHEEADNMLALWPTGLIASFTLNSNHEMYSGGHGLLEFALTNEKFETQGPYTYFALVNDDWVVLGLDSAYAATGFYQNGQLNQQQLDWIKALRAKGTFTAPGGAAKKVIVLTHHQGANIDGTFVEQLWGPLTAALGGGPDYWYWGHVHAGAVFAPIPTTQGKAVNARLVGHGGIPYVSDGMKKALVWTEQEAAGDPKIAKRTLNGFAVLHLDGPNVREEFVDEKGRHRWPGGT